MDYTLKKCMVKGGGGRVRAGVSEGDLGWYECDHVHGWRERSP